MHEVKQMLLESGFDRAMLYTADGDTQVSKSLLPELPAVINFGPPNTPETAFGKLAKARPNSPMMTGEYWAGWFDTWGVKHHATDAAGEAAALKWMLARGYSVNLYMFHGGTSFGWMNGADMGDGKYEPDTTSYDYDAPVSESGELKPKFFLFRDAIREVTGKTPPAPPAPLPVRALTPVKLERAVSVWDTLPKPIESAQTLSMEDVGQSYGYILYRTTIGTAQDALMSCTVMRRFTWMENWLERSTAVSINPRWRSLRLTTTPVWTFWWRIPAGQTSATHFPTIAPALRTELPWGMRR
jgi:beta-galactosidase